MAEQHNVNTPRAYLRPRHHTETDLWKVWPSKPEEVVIHAGIHFKWTAKVIDLPKNSSGPTYYFDSQPQTRMEVRKFYSKDQGKTWLEDVYTDGYIYRWSSKKISAEEQLVENAILESKEEWQRKRNRELSRERTRLLKKEAEELGITLTELRRRRTEQRKAENPHSVSKKDIEQTNRKMEVGPVLRDLQLEVDAVMGKLSGAGLSLNYIKKNKRKLEDAIEVLRSWQK